MLRRGCLFGSLGTLALCLIGCGLGYFVGLPNLRDAVREDFEDGIGTEVARQFATPASAADPIAPGTYVLSAEELRDRLAAETEGGNIEDVVVAITPAGIELGFSTSGQDATYTGTPTVRDGRLAIPDMDTDQDWLEWVFPADDLAEAIEDGVNTYLVENGLTLQAVDLAPGELTLTTTAA